MNISFTNDSWSEYIYWQKNDKKILKRINLLINDIKRDPFNGIGKPELLKYELSNCLSRRITDKHRLVYEISEYSIIVISCRFHY